MSLLCALLSRLEILFLSLSAVSVKDRGTAFNGDTVNGVIFVNSNVNTFGYSFLPVATGTIDAKEIKHSFASFLYMEL